MINSFANDNARISTKWLLRLIDGRGLKVKNLFLVTHLGTGTSHHLAILKDGRYICDCCMGTNLGIPCRHYFQLLTKVQGMKFNIGVVRARYDFQMYNDCQCLRIHWNHGVLGGIKIQILIYQLFLLFLSSIAPPWRRQSPTTFKLDHWHYYAIPWRKIRHNRLNDLLIQYPCALFTMNAKQLSVKLQLTFKLGNS